MQNIDTVWISYSSIYGLHIRERVISGSPIATICAHQ